MSEQKKDRGAKHQLLALTVKETAAELRIGINQCYGAIAVGAIPSVRIGKRILVPRAKLEKMLGA